MYSSWYELYEIESNNNYRIIPVNMNNDITVMAIHGGGIEPGTSEIATELFMKSGYNLYLFEGLKPNNNFSLHVPSTRFMEPECLNLAQLSQTVITIHGCANNTHDIYIGGRNYGLRFVLMYLLRDFTVSTHSKFRGVSSLNICNLSKTGRGVQIELSPNFRKNYPVQFIDNIIKAIEIYTT